MFSNYISTEPTPSYSVVIHAELLEDGTLRLHLGDDAQAFGTTTVKPNPCGDLSDDRVGKAFLQLCEAPLMSRPHFMARA